MQIIDSIHKKINNDTVLCIGSFDGIHLVHQKIIRQVVEDAKKQGYKSMVITFREHPLSILNPSKMPKLLMPLNEKIQKIRELGVDYLVLYDFSEVKNIPTEQFIEYLTKNYNMKKIICGFDFKFGYKNKGNVQYLKNASAKYGYDIQVFESLMISNKKISSTKIRTYIKYGEIEKANLFLGRPFNITDEVVRGKQLGRQLGFPTANIMYNSTYCIPQNGVYATITEFEGKDYISMTNIGYNPTFKNKYISIETYLMDFSGDLYSKCIKVKFLKKLRDETLFPDVHALIDQLEKDKKEAYKIVKKYLK